MKTIEERAGEFASNYRPGDYHDGVREGYGCGAYEQQKILIKKACEWLGKNIGSPDSPYQDILIGKFRKSMEEEL